MRKIINFIGILLYLVSSLYAQNIPSPLTTGTNYGVLELFADTATNELIIGGEFTIADGQPYLGSAMWNGNSWLYSGFEGGGWTNAFYKGELYTSGPGGTGYYQQGEYHFGPMMKRELSTGNWIPIGHDTASFWSDLPYNSTTGEMYDMEVEGDTMYLFGRFSRVGNIHVKNIAKYDGTNFYPFPPPDTTLNNLIWCAKFYKGELYIGGNFISSTDATVKKIAKWNGHSWENLGTPLKGLNSSVGNMEIYEGELIVSGSFEKSWGDKANGVMSWDGVQWKELGTGMKIDATDMMEYEGELYLTGKIANSPTPIHDVAKWNGSIWSGIGIDTLSRDNLPGLINTIEQWNGDLYFGGGFTQINGVACKNIAKYSATTGITPVLFEESIEVYPNPNEGTFRVTVPPTMQQTIAVTICDMSGRIVYQEVKVFERGEAVIETELVQGFYILRLEELESGRSVVRKVVLE